MNLLTTEDITQWREFLCHLFVYVAVLQLEAAVHILATDLKRQLSRQHPMALFFFFGISVNQIIVYKIIINLLNDLLLSFSIIAIAALIIRFKIFLFKITAIFKLRFCMKKE